MGETFDFIAACIIAAAMVAGLVWLVASRTGRAVLSGIFFSGHPIFWVFKFGAVVLTINMMILSLHTVSKPIPIGQNAAFTQWMADATVGPIILLLCYAIFGHKIVKSVRRELAELRAQTTN